MGLLARGGEDDKKPSTRRGDGGPPAGEPGATVTVMITDVFPPLVITAVVQDDGYFADEVYEQIAAARAAST